MNTTPERQDLAQIGNRKALVVGGTGSVGRTIVKALIKNSKAAITVFSRDEAKQYEMTCDPLYKDRVRFVIGDVRDLISLQRVMDDQEFVFHCAALKHVPFCEDNALEAVRTNVLGTANLVEAALRSRKVQKVVVCSTDKACSPSTTMGASKMLQERLIQSAPLGGPSMVCVRLGNLFESRGSVFHLFFKQRESGILTLTDAEMTRFIATLDEVIGTITFALFAAKHGEIVIRQDHAVKMYDVARSIAPKAHINFTGIRKNEKLHELLFSEHEARAIRVQDEFFVLDHSGGPVHYVEWQDWSSENRILAMSETYRIVKAFADRCGYKMEQ